MITINIVDSQYYDNVNNQFVDVEGGMFRFVHTLETISKWETKWKVPFLNAKHEPEQMRSYYKMMCLDDGLTDLHLVDYVVKLLNEYMADSRTATTIQNENNSPSDHKVLTSEVIYSYMVAANVPFEAAGWHINRLMMLLRVISASQEKPKMMTKEETMKSNAALNAERKAKYKTKG